MNRHPALSLDLDDGIDRKVLGQLRQRFLAVNAGRLQWQLSNDSIRFNSFISRS